MTFASVSYNTIACTPFNISSVVAAGELKSQQEMVTFQTLALQNILEVIVLRESLAKVTYHIDMA